MIMGKNIEAKFKTFDVAPSFKLLKTMGFGSYDLGTALSDIIDNSISADATKVDIVFEIDGTDSFLEIRDNGNGMTSEELEQAMKFAGKGVDDERKEKDLGKYGLGMKTASLYECGCLTVISKTKKTPMTAKRIDEDTITISQSWMGIDLNGSSFLEKYSFAHGTVIRWDKLKNLGENAENMKQYMFTRMREAEDYLMMVFHRFIEKENFTITINGRVVKPWNPIFQHPATILVDNKTLIYAGKKIIVRSYLLPSDEQCNENEKNELNRGDALKYQGFYVYRDNRIINYGTWLSMPHIPKHQKYNNVRITIDIPSSLDETFKVDFSKSSLLFPKELLNMFADIARTARAKSSESKKKKMIRHKDPAKKEYSDIWTVTTKEGISHYEINANHPLFRMYTSKLDNKERKALIKLLSKSIPYYETNGDRDFNYTEKEINEMMHCFYAMKLVQGLTIKEIREIMTNTEPFLHYLDDLNVFFESEEK